MYDTGELTTSSQFAQVGIIQAQRSDIYTNYIPIYNKHNNTHALIKNIKLISIIDVLLMKANFTETNLQEHVSHL